FSVCVFSPDTSRYRQHAVGVIVSWLGGRGVTLMGSQPQLVAGLLVGTVLGVALFRGVPVGPLIAAGLVSLIVGKQ
ncbi:DUF441 family protein, partial [Escherichia sp. TWPC-MK]